MERDRMFKVLCVYNSHQMRAPTKNKKLFTQARQLNSYKLLPVMQSPYWFCSHLAFNMKFFFVFVIFIPNMMETRQKPFEKLVHILDKGKMSHFLQIVSLSRGIIVCDQLVTSERVKKMHPTNRRILLCGTF